MFMTNESYRVVSAMIDTSLSLWRENLKGNMRGAPKCLVCRNMMPLATRCVWRAVYGVTSAQVDPGVMGFFEKR